MLLLPSHQLELDYLSPAQVAKAKVDHVDIIKFAEDVLGMEPNAVQIELGLPWFTSHMLEMWISLNENKNTIILSGNSIGKSMGLAIAAHHGFYARGGYLDSKTGLWVAGMTVVTIATRGEQVKNLWAKMRMLRMQALQRRGIDLPGDWKPAAHEVVDLKDPEHRMLGYTIGTHVGEDVATALSGLHYKGGIMVIGDECIGIKQSVLESADRLCPDPNDRKLYCGNPTEESAYIHEMEKMRKIDAEGNRTSEPLYNVLHFSSEDHPNVKYKRVIIPGCVTVDFCQEQLAKGGSRESSFYKTSILGQWPGDKADALIQTAWILRAQERSQARLDEDAYEAAAIAEAEAEHLDPTLIPRRERDSRGVALGLDVANEGTDLTVLSAISDGKLFFPKLSVPCWHRGLDTDHAVELVVRAIKEIPRVLSISIDDGGVGAIVARDLWKRQNEFPTVKLYITKGPRADPSSFDGRCSITRVLFGVPPFFKEDKITHRLMRDVLWWNFREALHLGKLMLPTDEELREVGFPPDVDFKAQIQNPIKVQDGHGGQGRIIVLDKRSAGGMGFRERAKGLPTISPDPAHSAILALNAWEQLPERQSAPKTVQEHFDVIVRAEIEATKQRAQNPEEYEYMDALMQRVTE